MISSSTTISQEYKALKVFVKELFPEPYALTLQVPPEQQQQELQRLRMGRRPEQFFFVVDFIGLSVIEADGLEEIGYSSKQFSFRQYLSMIASGSMLRLTTLLGKQTFMLSNRSLLQFMKPQFVTQLPLTQADGRVMLTKRTVSPWQITNTGRITAYLSEFIILKPYEDEPMNPRFVHLEPATEAVFNRIVAQLFANLPTQANPFPPKEMSILKLYVDPRYAGQTTEQFARLAGVTLKTLRTHNRNIVENARDMFGETLPVKTAFDVASYLKKCGLLG